MAELRQLDVRTVGVILLALVHESVCSEVPATVMMFVRAV